MDYFDEETVINNEYDYSNIIPIIENITYIIQYCDQIYHHFLKLVEEDESKNERLKYEFQNYQYKKSYGIDFQVKIEQKNYKYIICKSYHSFIEAVKDGKVFNVSRLDISLNLDYRRGRNGQFIEHQNLYDITFKPYKISFVRKANHKEADMEQIENNLNEMLKKFPVANTIFCSK